LPTIIVVSVWPYESRKARPQARRTCSMISGFTGSPAALTSRRATFHCLRSCWISIRQTVGGAQNVVT
jgi:hypothetical protein